MNVSLLLRGISNALGGIILCRSDIDITVHHKRHFLTIGRDGNLCCATLLHLTNQILFVLISHHRHIDFLRLSTLFHCIELTIVAKAQSTVVGNAQETHRMIFHTGKLLVCIAVDTPFEHIERTFLFAQIVERLPIGCPYWVTILTIVGSELLVLVCLALRCCHPYITGNR